LFSGGNANLVSSDAAKEADFAMPVFESFGIAKDSGTSGLCQLRTFREGERQLHQ
jgi:hypothetical protein